jgi:hypothetical protein
MGNERMKKQETRLQNILLPVIEFISKIFINLQRARNKPEININKYNKYNKYERSSSRESNKL